jgi:hypothetical protein
MTIQKLQEWLADPVNHNLVLNRTEVAMLLHEIERATEGGRSDDDVQHRRVSSPMHTARR